MSIADILVVADANCVSVGRYEEMLAEKDIHVLVFLAIFLLRTFPRGKCAYSVLFEPCLATPHREIRYREVILTRNTIVWGTCCCSQDQY